MCQHLAQSGLTNNVKHHVTNCLLSKRRKGTTKNYGYLTPKSINKEKILWNALRINLIGLCAIIDGVDKDSKLQAIAFTDPAVGQFEVAKTHKKTA